MPADGAATARYRLHSRIRAFAVGLTVFLVFLAALLARRIPDQAFSGILASNSSVLRISAGSPGEAAGFQKGDRIVAINGIASSRLAELSECIAHAKPGDTLVYSVRRGPAVLAIPVTLAAMPRSEVLRKTSIVLVGLSFISIGLVVYFRRSDKIALVFYLLCLSFGLVLADVVSLDVASQKQGYVAALNDLILLALPALFLHFFLVFPERSPVLAGRPKIEQAIYLPGALLYVFWQYLNLMIFRFGTGPAGVIGALQIVTAIYFAAFILLGLASFVRSYVRSSAPPARRKLRLVVWGTVLGISPIVAVRVLLSAWPSLEIPGEKFVFLPLLLVPLAFGHAIVRYGLLDLEIVVKRSVIYALLTASLAAVYFAMVYGIGRLAGRFIGRADLLFSLVSIFCISLLISPLRSRIGSSVEKIFFREEYNYRSVLRQVSHSLSGMVSLEGLLSYLATRVSEVLHPSIVAIFLLDEPSGQYAPRCAVNGDVKRLGPFSKDGGLAQLLASRGQTLNAERRFAVDRPLDLSEEEQRGLAELDSSLVVPFTFKSRLLGFMSIGRRASGSYYALADVELLETLCDQASAAIENVSLYLETVEKHKMEQELEVARDIQRRLLPRAFPEIRGLSAYGMNKPSKHVGGDYYDIIPLGAGKVGIVIADVAGKGVPAALLMASVQSSLRAEAAPWRQPSEVISLLNGTIFEHTSGDTFVTIFYGIIDFAAGSLTYCSAGQTPPFILRRDLSCERLDKTSLVLGIESGPEFTDTAVRVCEGDLVFLYTDGITDELDGSQDPYGEDRLLEILKEVYDGDLEAIVERVYAAVLRHTGGSTQDDLTVLALRIEPLAAKNNIQLRPPEFRSRSWVNQECDQTVPEGGESDVRHRADTPV